MRNLLLLVTFFIGSLIILEAQCYPDRHSTNWFDQWASCEAFPSPNSMRGNSHWIMYDLGQVYRLFQLHIWNYNDPSHLDWGFSRVAIDYSMDGDNWSQAGTFTLDQASGTSRYEGMTGPDLEGKEARYVLLTAVENFGGSCFGLGEVRFGAEATESTNVTDALLAGSECLQVEVYPNPFADDSRMLVQSVCEGVINWEIHDLLGRSLQSGQMLMRQGFQDVKLPGSELTSGTYLLTVRQGQALVQQKLVKAGMH